MSARRVRPSLAAAVLACGLLAAPRAARAEELPTALEKGKVSFVADRSVYLSIGAESGVEVGAEVVLLSDGKRVGLLLVEAVASRTSVAAMVVIEGEIRPGDVVLVRVTRRPSSPVPLTGPVAAAPGEKSGPAPEGLEELWLRVEAAPAAKVAYRGDAAADRRAPAAAGGTPAPGAPGAPAASGAPGAPASTPPPGCVVHGSVTLGVAGSVDRPTDGAPDRTWIAPRGSATLTVERIAGEDLTFRFRGDASAILQDHGRLDRAGRPFDHDVQVSELSLTWVGESVPIRLTIGRTLAAEAPQSGLVDGARADVLLGPIEVGGFGGLDAAPGFDDRGRIKLGASFALRTPESWDARYQLSVAYVRTMEGSRLDRQLLALDQRVTVLPWLTAYNFAEVDLFAGTANPGGRPSVDLTSFSAGVRVRPVDVLDVGFSFDRRRIFFGLREAALLGPATVALVDPGPLVTYRADARLSLPAACWVRASVDRRLGGGDSTAFGGEVGCDALFGTGVRAWLGASVNRARTTQGLTAFVHASVPLTDRLNLGAGYTLRADEYRPQGPFSLASGDRVVRHEAAVSVDYSFSWGLSLWADASYELGGDADRLAFSVAGTLRF